MSAPKPKRTKMIISVDPATHRMLRLKRVEWECPIAEAAARILSDIAARDPQREQVA